MTIYSLRKFEGGGLSNKKSVRQTDIKSFFFFDAIHPSIYYYPTGLRD